MSQADPSNPVLSAGGTGGTGSTGGTDGTGGTGSSGGTDGTHTDGTGSTDGTGRTDGTGSTGDAVVDEALQAFRERTAQADGSLDEHAEAGEQLHRALQERLADLGGD